MNLRVWLIAGILCGLPVPSSLAESRWPTPEISFSPHASADTADKEAKNCDTGKEPDLRIAACTEFIRKNAGATEKLGLAFEKLHAAIFDQGQPGIDDHMKRNRLSLPFFQQFARDVLGVFGAIFDHRQLE